MAAQTQSPQQAHDRIRIDRLYTCSDLYAIIIINDRDHNCGYCRAHSNCIIILLYLWYLLQVIWPQATISALQWNFVLSFIHSLHGSMIPIILLLHNRSDETENYVFTRITLNSMKDRLIFNLLNERQYLIESVNCYFYYFSATIKASFLIIIESSHKGICNCDF